jgi:formyl-CoA transferase
LVELLIRHGVPCAPVRTIREVASDPELERRGLVRRGEFGGDRDVKVLGSAVKLSGVRGDETSARVSRLGEDAADVLGGIGIGVDEIERLRRDGVI